MAAENNYTLITGATSGIGREFTHIFAENGHNMILVARSEEELQQLADDLCSRYNVAAIPIAKDLTEPDAAQEIHDDVTTKGLNVNILVNNAGQGYFAQTDMSHEPDIIQLNITSLVLLTRLFLNDMLARSEGKILNVPSITGPMPAPLLAVYEGTKAFAHSFTQSVIKELKGTNVTMATLLPEGDPADVARKGYKALMGGDTKVITGKKNKSKNTDSTEEKKDDSENTIKLKPERWETQRQAASDTASGAPAGDRLDHDVNARSSGRQSPSSDPDGPESARG